MWPGLWAPAKRLTGPWLGVGVSAGHAALNERTCADEGCWARHLLLRPHCLVRPAWPAGCLSPRPVAQPWLQQQPLHLGRRWQHLHMQHAQTQLGSLAGAAGSTA